MIRTTRHEQKPAGGNQLGGKASHLGIRAERRAAIFPCRSKRRRIANDDVESLAASPEALHGLKGIGALQADTRKAVSLHCLFGALERGEARIDQMHAAGAACRAAQT